MSLELSAVPGPRFAISEGSLIKLIFRDETRISRDDAVTAEVLLDLTAVNGGGRRSWAEILPEDAERRSNRLIVLRGLVKALRQSRVLIGVPLSVVTRSLAFFTHVRPLCSPYTQRALDRH